MANVNKQQHLGENVVRTIAMDGKLSSPFQSIVHPGCRCLHP